MPSPIQPLGNLAIPSASRALLDSSTPIQQGAGFQDLLLSSLQQTIDAQRISEAAIESSLTGEDITQVEVLSAVKKADMLLRMMLQIRNKLLEAYNEIKQMQM